MSLKTIDIRKQFYQTIKEELFIPVEQNSIEQISRNREIHMK